METTQTRPQGQGAITLADVEARFRTILREERAAVAGAEQTPAQGEDPDTRQEDESEVARRFREWLSGTPAAMRQSGSPVSGATVVVDQEGHLLEFLPADEGQIARIRETTLRQPGLAGVIADLDGQLVRGERRVELVGEWEGGGLGRQSSAGNRPAGRVSGPHALDEPRRLRRAAGRKRPADIIGGTDSTR